MNGTVVVIVLLFIAAAISWLIQSASRKEKAQQSELEKQRRAARAREKYGNTTFADDIAAGLIRQGMTYQMVLDSWGEPAGVDRKVYKTKTKEVLKYNPGPRRSYGSKVTIEDGIVVGWDQR